MRSTWEVHGKYMHGKCMGSAWEVHAWEVHGKCMGKVPQSRYTMGLSIPANLLSIPSIPLSSNCIVVKRFAHAH